MKNLTQWKSSIIGLLLIWAGFFNQWIIEDPNVYITIGSVLIGIGLLFAKDRIIDIIVKFLSKK